MLIPVTLKELRDPIPPITSLAVDAIPALPLTSGILGIVTVIVEIFPDAVAVIALPSKFNIETLPPLPTIEPSS